LNRYWSKEDVKGCDKEDIMTETIPTIENCMLRPEPITRFGIIRSLISGLTDHTFRFEPIVLELFPK